MKQQEIKDIFLEAKSTLCNFIDNEENIQSVKLAGDILVEAIKKRNKIISCGNGGSMSDAMHFAEELSGRFRNNRAALPAISISDPTHITCTGNDFGFEFIFSRFVEGLGNSGDVLLGISTSGNSKNVINAAKSAKAKGMKVIGLTGKNGGDLANLCDVEIRVAHNGFADRVQEVHIKIIHALIYYIESNLEA